MTTRGSRFENNVKIKLKLYDFDIYRSAASQGVFDLIVLTPGDNINIGVQCKAGGSITSYEKKRIIDAAYYRNIYPILATKMCGKIVFIDMIKEDPIKNFHKFEGKHEQKEEEEDSLFR